MKINTEHIIAYLEKRLPAHELIEFNKQLNASPELQKEVNDIRFIWETSALLKLQKQINTEKRWSKIRLQIKFDLYKKKLLNFSRSAAAILIIPLLLITVSLLHTLKEYKEQPVEQIEVTSAHGLISKIILPDSSEVWLNSGSSLSYPTRFTGNQREVHLTGEAYFNVKSSQSLRFNVIATNQIKVSAYGTEFNVCAYKEDEYIEATLVKGNIDVSLTNQHSFGKPHPGQQVIFNKQTRRMDTINTNLQVKTAWKDGKMIFRRANMNEIIQRLSRHFNVDIKLEGEELYNYEYSATFTTETLNDILQLLEKTAPINCFIIEPKQDKNLTYTQRTVIIQTTK